MQAESIFRVNFTDEEIHTLLNVCSLLEELRSEEFTESLCETILNRMAEDDQVESVFQTILDEYGADVLLNEIEDFLRQLRQLDGLNI